MLHLTSVDSTPIGKILYEQRKFFLKLGLPYLTPLTGTVGWKGYKSRPAHISMGFFFFFLVGVLGHKCGYAYFFYNYFADVVLKVFTCHRIKGKIENVSQKNKRKKKGSKL